MGKVKSATLKEIDRLIPRPSSEDCSRVPIAAYRRVMSSVKPRQTLQLRAGCRVSAQAQFHFFNDRVFGTGTVWNLSRTGARVDTTESVSSGAILTLFLDLPDGGSMVVIDRAKVCWIRGHTLGLQILTMESEDEVRLTQFMTALI